MSLFAVFAGVGAVIGAGMGGCALILYGFGLLGITLGSMGIIAAIIFKFVAIDPTESCH